MSNVTLIVIICVIVIAAIVVVLAVRSRRRRAATRHHIGLPELGSLGKADLHDESVAEMRAAHRSHDGESPHQI